MPNRRTVKPGSPPVDPRELYVTKGLSIADLAALLQGHRGCSKRHLTNRCAKEGWVALRVEYESNASAQAIARSVTTEAEHRSKQLARFRKIESTVERALEHLLADVEAGKGLLGEKQGSVAGVKELTQTLAIARESIGKLADTRDDRFTELMDAAHRMAEGKIDDVEDFNTDDAVLEAMTPKVPAGLEYLRFKLGTAAADSGEKPPATPPPTDATP